MLLNWSSVSMVLSWVYSEVPVCPRTRGCLQGLPATWIIPVDSFTWINDHINYGLSSIPNFNGRTTEVSHHWRSQDAFSPVYLWPLICKTKITMITSYAFCAFKSSVAMIISTNGKTFPCGAFKPSVAKSSDRQTGKKLPCCWGFAFAFEKRLP